MPTYKDYTEFCRLLRETGVPTYTVENACRHLDALKKPFVLLKHDVEDKPEKALAISRIEHSFGIAATYYVHSFFLRDARSVAILKDIAELGHEIGYHYDVLDNNDGDKGKAVQEFRDALTCFAGHGFTVRTICPHGNPLKKRVGYSSNKDFFLDPAIRSRFSDIVDVYLTFPEMVEQDYLYITDAGYAYSYRDAKTTKTDATERSSPLNDKHEILQMVRNGHSLIISTHSHRYFRWGCVASVRIALYKTAKWTAKALYRTRWGKSFIDRFYFIAKKI